MTHKEMMAETAARAIAKVKARLAETREKAERADLFDPYGQQAPRLRREIAEDTRLLARLEAEARSLGGDGGYHWSSGAYFETPQDAVSPKPPSLGKVRSVAVTVDGHKVRFTPEEFTAIERSGEKAIEAAARRKLAGGDHG